MKDDFYLLDEALLDCDAVIVGSPTYVLSPTGRLKQYVTGSVPLMILHSEKPPTKRALQQVSRKQSCRMPEASKNVWERWYLWEVP